MQMLYVILEKVQHDIVTKMFAVQRLKTASRSSPSQAHLTIIKNATFEFGRETGY